MKHPVALQELQNPIPVLRNRAAFRMRMNRGSEMRNDFPVAAGLAFGMVLALLLCVSCAHHDERPQARASAFRGEQSPDKLVERGRAFAGVGDLTRAEEYLAAAMDAGANPRLVMPLLLMVCVQDNRFRLAAQYAEEHLQRHPSDVRSRLVLGTIYSGLGEPGPAERELRRVISEKPDEAQAHFALAVVLRDAKGDSVGADEQFREYLRYSPTGPYAEEARSGLLRSIP
jgi:Flp pilus assembly protein TadD